MSFSTNLYVQREDAKQIIAQKAPSILQAFETNLKARSVKQHHVFFGAIGGSGAGKTRAATETTRILSTVKGFEHVQEVCVDFSNGFHILPFERGDPDSILGARIFAAVLRRQSIARFYEHAKFRYYYRRGVFKTRLVLRVVSVKFREWMGLDKETPLPITLILDEFQKTIQSTPAWKHITYTIGSYTCNTEGPNEEAIASKLVVVPILAGTLLKQEVTFAPTDYQSVLLPLPSFNIKSVRTILKSEQIDKRLMMGRELKQFWYHMGLVPRNLEDALHTARRVLSVYSYVYDETHVQFPEMIDYLFRKTRAVILERYKYFQGYDYTDNDKKLLFHALAAKVPDGPASKEKWLLDAIREGKVFKTDANLLYLPYFVFMELIDRIYRNVHRFLPLDRTAFQWYHMEEVDLKTLACRINGYIEFLNMPLIRMNQLFPGARGTCGSHKIKIRDVTYVEALEHFGQKDVHTGRYVHKSPQDTIRVSGSTVVQPKERIQYVMRCVQGNKGFDGILFAKADAQDVLILIQHKFKQSPKQHGTDSPPTITPKEWYEAEAEAIKAQYPDHKLYFVYVTNAKLGAKLVENATEKYGDLLIVDGNEFHHYVSPNILPYYKEISDFDGLL
jgi:hypothetical protein